MATFRPVVKDTSYSGGDARTFEHTNSNKAFYYANQWWAVLPNGSNWYVEKGSTFGTKASSAMLGTTARADIAFDEVHSKLWVLNYGSSITEPHLYKYGYTGTWTREADVKISSAVGLTSNNWNKNGEMTLGLDPSGDPIIGGIGSSKIGKVGLHIAYATPNTNLTKWAEFTIDPGTTRDGGSNGDSKAVFVTYGNNIGIAYSADGATNSWKFATHGDAPGNAYGGGWGLTTFATSKQVSIDNHISAVSDGTDIYIAMKDASNNLWVTKGHPGAWSPNPTKVVTGDPSRPTLVLDDTNKDLYLFYQDHTGSPNDIYYKVSDTENAAFNFSPGGLGKLVMSSGSSMTFSNPQLPAHNVGSDTGNSFNVFASSGSGIYSSQFDLGSPGQPQTVGFDGQGEPIHRPLHDYYIV